MDYSAQVRRRFGAVLEAAAGTAADGDVTQAVGEAQDRSIGVWVRATLQLREDAVEDAHFAVFGCPDTLAAADLLGERLRGAAVEQCKAIDVHELAATLQIPTEKLGRLIRLEDAVLAAVEAAGHHEGKR